MKFVDDDDDDEDISLTTRQMNSPVNVVLSAKCLVSEPIISELVRSAKRPESVLITEKMFEEVTFSGKCPALSVTSRPTTRVSRSDLSRVDCVTLNSIHSITNDQRLTFVIVSKTRETDAS